LFVVAAALLHPLRGGDNDQHWPLPLAAKSVALRSVRPGSGFSAEMAQARPEFGATPDLSLIHISNPTSPSKISYPFFC
ncbi:hypothetical protein ACV354_31000, partial [Pseudomonas aeruginosa]